MIFQDPSYRSARRSRGTVPRAMLLALFVAAAAGPMGLAAAIAPGPLVLPAISLMSIGIAALAAFAAWTLGAKRGGSDVTAWDVAGVFTLIGCAAAMMTENEAALEYLIETRDNR